MRRIVVVLLLGCSGRAVSGEETSGESTSSSSGSSGSSTSTSSSSGSSTSDASSSSSSGDTSSSSGGTTGAAEPCVCAPDEVCIEHATDACGAPHVPVTECVPRHDACTDAEIVCDTECGWESCGGPGCIGFGADVCGAPSEGLVCGGYIECNLFTQSCPEGEKCSSWSSDGDEIFDRTRCVPIVNEPVPVGGACMWEGSPWSGIDDCVGGAMCLRLSDGAKTGICRAACVGNPWNATCDDPETMCVLEGDYFGWCLPP